MAKNRVHLVSAFARTIVVWKTTTPGKKNVAKSRLGKPTAKAANAPAVAQYRGFPVLTSGPEASVELARPAPPAGYGARLSFRRSKLPRKLSPCWHEMVKSAVEQEEAKVRTAENKIKLQDMVRASRRGGLGSVLSLEMREEIEDANPEAMLDLVNWDAAWLALPEVVEIIRNQRARLANAIGGAAWREAIGFFYRLGEALTGIQPWTEPGLPAWFRRLIRADYQATVEDVRRERSNYANLPSKVKRAQTRVEYLAQQLKLRRLESDVPREVAIAAVASRWHLPPWTVHHWLRPTRSPAYRQRMALPVRACEDGAGNRVLRVAAISTPFGRTGRPPKSGTRRPRG